MAVNSAVLAVLFLAFAAAATLTDRVVLRRAGRRSPPGAPAITRPG
jgi:hypothetical protein